MFSRSRLLNRSLVIILFLLLVSASSIMYINFDDEIYKYAFSSSSGVLGFMVFLCYTVCSENAHSLCSSSHTIEDEDEKEEPRMKARSGSFQNFLKPEIVSDTFCSATKLPDSIEVDVRMEKLRKLRFCPEDIEWKEVDRLLVEKSIDFTVHHPQRAPLGVVPIEAPPPQQDCEEAVTSPFQLQQLDDSPRSSQLHVKEPDGQEDLKNFVEVPHNTPPDILEPTKQAFFSQQVLVNQVLDEQCVITTTRGEQCHLVSGSDGVRTSSYSTFRPPANPEDDKIFLSETRSKTPSPSLMKDKVALKTPDIGDEPIVPDTSTLKKKDVLGMHVASPVVPAMEKEDQKKGWSITTV